MGGGASKESQQLYEAVQNGDTSAVKALRHDGASLEFMDKEGRTPLMLACTRGDLFEMVSTLLNLGANVKAYQPGSDGGQPLHQAAKLGLERTVFLLLYRGAADPLAVNDDVLTPLDLARNRGHLNVVRMIEDRIAIFSGMLRELSGLEFLETFAPQWATKRIWAVVVPTESDSGRPVKCELVIYMSPKHPLPRTLIPLARSEVEEPKFTLPDPVLVLTDKKTQTKYMFLAEAPGDKSQTERLYRACKAFEQAPADMPSPTLESGLVRPLAQQQPQAPTTPSVSSAEVEPMSQRKPLRRNMRTCSLTTIRGFLNSGEGPRGRGWRGQNIKIQCPFSNRTGLIAYTRSELVALQFIRTTLAIGWVTKTLMALVRYSQYYISILVRVGIVGIVYSCVLVTN